jgi:uncharacterized protein YhhL (DUF1145 family)
VSGLKRGILTVWIACIAAFAFGAGSALGQLGRTVFWLMAVAHIAEFLFFRSLFQRTGEPLLKHFWQTLLFGMFHIREVQAGDES